jgi:hypothetical protein
MITKSNNWGGFSLDSAGVGDHLMVSGGGWHVDYTPVTITRLTKSRVTTSDGKVWMRDSHRLIGSGKWSRVSLHAYDEKALSEARRGCRKEMLAHKLSDTRFRDFDLPFLEQIYAAVEAQVELQKAKVF